MNQKPISSTSASEQQINQLSVLHRPSPHRPINSFETIENSIKLNKSTNNSSSLQRSKHVANDNPEQENFKNEEKEKKSEKELANALNSFLSIPSKRITRNHFESHKSSERAYNSSVKNDVIRQPSDANLHKRKKSKSKDILDGVSPHLQASSTFSNPSVISQDSLTAKENSRTESNDEKSKQKFESKDDDLMQNPAVLRLLRHQREKDALLRVIDLTEMDRDEVLAQLENERKKAELLQDELNKEREMRKEAERKATLHTSAADEEQMHLAANSSAEDGEKGKGPNVVAASSAAHKKRKKKKSKANRSSSSPSLCSHTFSASSPADETNQLMSSMLQQAIEAFCEDSLPLLSAASAPQSVSSSSSSSQEDNNTPQKSEQQSNLLGASEPRPTSAKPKETNQRLHPPLHSPDELKEQPKEQNSTAEGVNPSPSSTIRTSSSSHNSSLSSHPLSAQTVSSSNSSSSSSSFPPFSSSEAHSRDFSSSLQLPRTSITPSPSHTAQSPSLSALPPHHPSSAATSPSLLQTPSASLKDRLRTLLPPRVRSTPLSVPHQESPSLIPSSASASASSSSSSSSSSPPPPPEQLEDHSSSNALAEANKQSIPFGKDTKTINQNSPVSDSTNLNENHPPIRNSSHAEATLASLESSPFKHSAALLLSAAPARDSTPFASTKALLSSLVSPSASNEQPHNTSATPPAAKQDSSAGKRTASERRALRRAEQATLQASLQTSSESTSHNQHSPPLSSAQRDPRVIALQTEMAKLKQRLTGVSAMNDGGDGKDEVKAEKDEEKEEEGTRMKAFGDGSARKEQENEYSVKDGEDEMFASYKQKEADIPKISNSVEEKGNEDDEDEEDEEKEKEKEKNSMRLKESVRQIEFWWKSRMDIKAAQNELSQLRSERRASDEFSQKEGEREREEEGEGEIKDKNTSSAMNADLNREEDESKHFHSDHSSSAASPSHSDHQMMQQIQMKEQKEVKEMKEQTSSVPCSPVSLHSHTSSIATPPIQRFSQQALSLSPTSSESASHPLLSSASSFSFYRSLQQADSEDTTSTHPSASSSSAAAAPLPITSPRISSPPPRKHSTQKDSPSPTPTICTTLSVPLSATHSPSLQALSPFSPSLSSHHSFIPSTPTRTSSFSSPSSPLGRQLEQGNIRSDRTAVLPVQLPKLSHKHQNSSASLSFALSATPPLSLPPLAHTHSASSLQNQPPFAKQPPVAAVLSNLRRFADKTPPPSLQFVFEDGTVSNSPIPSALLTTSGMLLQSPNQQRRMALSMREDKKKMKMKKNNISSKENDDDKENEGQNVSERVLSQETSANRAEKSASASSDGLNGYQNPPTIQSLWPLKQQQHSHRIPLNLQTQRKSESEMRHFQEEEDALSYSSDEEKGMEEEKEKEKERKDEEYEEEDDDDDSVYKHSKEDDVQTHRRTKSNGSVSFATQSSIRKGTRNENRREEKKNKENKSNKQKGGLMKEEEEEEEEDYLTANDVKEKQKELLASVSKQIEKRREEAANVSNRFASLKERNQNKVNNFGISDEEEEGDTEDEDDDEYNEDDDGEEAEEERRKEESSKRKSENAILKHPIEMNETFKNGKEATNRMDEEEEEDDEDDDNEEEETEEEEKEEYKVNQTDKLKNLSIDHPMTENRRKTSPSHLQPTSPDAFEAIQTPSPTSSLSSSSPSLPPFASSASAQHDQQEPSTSSYSAPKQDIYQSQTIASKETSPFSSSSSSSSSTSPSTSSSSSSSSSSSPLSSTSASTSSTRQTPSTRRLSRYEALKGKTMELSQRLKAIGGEKRQPKKEAEYSKEQNSDNLMNSQQHQQLHNLDRSQKNRLEATGNGGVSGKGAAPYSNASWMEALEKMLSEKEQKRESQADLKRREEKQQEKKEKAVASASSSNVHSEHSHSSQPAGSFIGNLLSVSQKEAAPRSNSSSLDTLLKRHNPVAVAKPADNTQNIPSSSLNNSEEDASYSDDHKSTAVQSKEDAAEMKEKEFDGNIKKESDEKKCDDDAHDVSSKAVLTSSFSDPFLLRSPAHLSSSFSAPLSPFTLDGAHSSLPSLPSSMTLREKQETQTRLAPQTTAAASPPRLSHSMAPLSQQTPSHLHSLLAARTSTTSAHSMMPETDNRLNKLMNHFGPAKARTLNPPISSVLTTKQFAHA
ncbi:uncharacterized protein MONOS_7749 [Monocercomonoides exilis]|uniref:uncharacterized protein n=1 Tax=Monocercomonoides exilis TaxID=2049356 RepID=UPI00355A1ADF|nr:hypothetical protein MONOS_7749 [Monocercomonoides exilis]|eukprot:MONOS_7749.1-p1 / transcript=MONOS_7749.1 / gene=MONOS_7749 / organism=Monocercomonoides_exilis_PA203 / gene_product=unspecified product / transcript_product=unspecified product / location=Mono_scaffold00273:28429-34866(+) / protein_length=2146 / sequence_SO=supercontig / SO=protein_coding / is_pseudo=false